MRKIAVGITDTGTEMQPNNNKWTPNVTKREQIRDQHGTKTCQEVPTMFQSGTLAEEMISLKILHLYWETFRIQLRSKIAPQ